jgi:hypothetical protein
MDEKRAAKVKSGVARFPVTVLDILAGVKNEPCPRLTYTERFHCRLLNKTT